MNHDPHGGGSREGSDFQNNLSNHASPLESGLVAPSPNTLGTVHKWCISVPLCISPATSSNFCVPGLAPSPHLSPAISPGSASNHVNVNEQQIKTEVKAEPGEGGAAQLVESSTMQVKANQSLIGEMEIDFWKIILMQ